MSESVRLLQMTLHWHMTGDRHFRFLRGSEDDIEMGDRATGYTQPGWNRVPSREPRRGATRETTTAAAARHALKPVGVSSRASLAYYSYSSPRETSSSSVQRRL
ncbi:hypothetical protein NHX12_010015 [Muraenolepis orangiensis]|uniref:Uncharacterized protein n=1 Tax=Muraenolepis orangiensis TaxID=630683 RepID=A0A9Q0I6W5_9TELE|nr:hypothetical protein NHX12_010015 [Muraenolepis orangiensis]